MGQGGAAEIAVPGVGVGVEVDHAEGPVAGDGAHDRQRDQMVAAGRQRHRAGPVQCGEEALDAPDRVVQVDRVDRGVAAIGDPANLVGADVERVVGAPDQARHVADFTRAVAGAGAVGGAAVPRHADQRDVHVREVGDVGQPHEGRHGAEARHVHAADRFVEAVAHRRRAPRLVRYRAAAAASFGPKISASAAAMPST